MIADETKVIEGPPVPKAAVAIAHPLRLRFTGPLRLLFCSLVLVGLLYCFRHPLMGTAAQWWIVNDVLVKSDAVVVLGGGLESRPFVAADMYKRGLTSVILVSNIREGPVVQMGIMQGETKLTVELLHRSGVPDAAIQLIGTATNSTYDESQGVRAWVSQHPATRIIIPTDPFHTRRVKWLFSRDLKDKNVEVLVVSIPNPRYDPATWWKSEESFLSFQNEIVKLVYYWLHY